MLTRAERLWRTISEGKGGAISRELPLILLSRFRRDLL